MSTSKMGLVLAMVLGMLATGILAATAETPTFAGLKFGSSVSAIQADLLRKGYEAEVDDDGDVKFSGTLMGHRCSGWALFANGKMGKVDVNIHAPDRNTISTYKDVVKTLIGKYGQPDKTYKFFKDPYYEGDGYEEQAIQLGKGFYVTVWEDTLMVSITEQLNVNIGYESPDWGAEADRRAAKQASDL